MNEIWQGALMLVLVALGIHFVIYANSHIPVRVIDPQGDFVVRYPRIFLWLGIVFFAILCCVTMLFIIWNVIDALKIVLLSFIAVVGIPALLLALVWRIKVYDEFIVTVNMFGIKKQIYYKDIQYVRVTKNAFFMETTIKNYRFSSNIIYREEFLQRLSDNNVNIERFL
ncbi:MAG: DUF6560 family protein [Christensenella sp.]